MKILIFSLNIFVLLSCSQQKNEIIIKLDQENGFGMFRQGKRVIWPSEFILDYQGVPNDIKEYVVRYMPLQNDQHYFNLYRNKQIDLKHFQSYSSRYNIDTTKLTREFIDSKLLILTGTNQNNKRVIIIDSDNDKDFSDEKINEYDYPISKEKQNEIDSLLPIIPIEYEHYAYGKRYQKKLNIKPSPYEGSLLLTFNANNPIEKNYYLFAGVPHYKKGVVEINKKQFNICVANQFTDVIYTSQNASIFIYDKNTPQPSELNGDIPFQIGDIFNTDNIDYQIESISLFGDTLNLRYIGENTHPSGFLEGFYVPKFLALGLDNFEFSLDHYKGKYILFDFWGTWCKPFVELIPELNKLNQDFSGEKFVLVSVAYDIDINNVKNFVTTEEMNWLHLFVDQRKQDKNSLIEKLKITSFPSTVLIDPDGKIIARNRDFNELREILSLKAKKE